MIKKPKCKTPPYAAAPAAPMTLASGAGLPGATGRTFAHSCARPSRSAVKRVAKLLGNEPAAIAVDMGVISAGLAAVNAVAKLGSSSKSLANIRSDFLAAVKASGIGPSRPSSRRR